MDYEPELFGKALPCLIAIGCALPPDYSLSKNSDDDLYGKPTGGVNLNYFKFFIDFHYDFYRVLISHNITLNQLQQFI